MSVIAPFIARPRRRPAPASGRPASTRVPAAKTPRAATRVRPIRAGVFGVFVGIILLAGLVTMLVINTSLAQGAFRVSELKKQSTDLVQQQQALEKAVAEQQTPGNLETRARALGMVPQSTPVFLRLSDGKVLGKAKPQAAQAQQATEGAAGVDVPPTQWVPWNEPGVAP